jgi:hypothetical protein
MKRSPQPTGFSDDTDIIHIDRADADGNEMRQALPRMKVRTCFKSQRKNARVDAPAYYSSSPSCIMIAAAATRCLKKARYDAR